MKFRSVLSIVTLTLIFSNAFAQNSFKVKFRDFEFMPQENMHQFDPSLINTEEVVSNYYYRFVQFDNVLKTEDITTLNEQGMALLSFIPSNTYLVAIPHTLSKSQLQQHGIRSIWAVESSLKQSSNVKNRSLPDWAIEGNRALLMIKYYKNLDQELIINLLGQKKIDVIHSNGINNFLQISVPIERVGELGALPYIEYVEEILPPDVKDDRRGRSLHRVNKLDPNMVGGRNYTGKGINVLVRDDGKVFEHIDFQGRLFQSLAGSSFGSHGDGVAGIMAGAGNLNPVNRGMAHESTVHVLNYNASFLDETMSLFFNEDVIVTNSSYSNGCNVGYTTSTQTVDQQTFDNPTLLHVFSAGNSGQGMLEDDELVSCGYGAGLTWGNITGGHKQGKNVIATANLNYRGEIMTSSSRGPAHDGRIKPDIAANGNNHVSTDESQSYMSFGGTSGAAPVVAGVTAMLHEAYEVNHGTRANAALLKAMMLNTATDRGNKGPDFIYGWGSLNAYRAALGIEEGRFLNSTINQDEQKTHTITIPENVAEVRVMTYWPDPEASTFSFVSLLNDLNSTLEAPDGSIHMPWILDPTPDPVKLNTPATKGVDFLNNMEQIAIDNPQAGEYTLQVNGDLVPFGTNEYYVVWEFRMNEIDIIFPDGGENLNFVSTEVIHWDATGDEGEFTITHIDSEGNESQIGQVNGGNRLFQWFTPFEFSEKSKIRVSRDGLSDESTEPFLLANNPTQLEVTFDEEREPNWLHWSTDTIPVSYNIYVLGDFVMEKITTIEADSFLIPDEPMFKNTFLAVSANFPDGTEGKRSLAVATTPQPIALATNNKNDKPCVNKPVRFESQTTDNIRDYNWQFGANVFPKDANTEGPHFVTYTKTGPNLAALIVTNDGGTDEVYFFLTVQDALDPAETDLVNEGGGVYNFMSNVNGANSYVWDFGDGNTGEGKSVTHTYQASGTYTVTLLAENSCGAVTEIDEVMINLTNVNDLTVNDFTISPNPNRGEFNVELPDLEGSDLLVQLISIEGKLIDSRYIKNTEAGQKLMWNDVPSGIYALNFSIENKELTKKVIVR